MHCFKLSKRGVDLSLIILIVMLLFSSFSNAQSFVSMDADDDQFCGVSGSLSLMLTFDEGGPYDYTIGIYEKSDDGINILRSLEENGVQSEYGIIEKEFTQTVNFDDGQSSVILIMVLQKAGDNSGNEYSREEEDFSNSAQFDFYKPVDESNLSGLQSIDELNSCGYSFKIEGEVDDFIPEKGWAEYSNGDFEDDNSFSTLFTAVEPGSHQLYFEMVNGVCEYNHNVEIVTYGYPSATISTKSEICGEGQAELKFEMEGSSPWTIQYRDDSDSYGYIENVTEKIYVEKVDVLGTTNFTIVNLEDKNGCSPPSSLSDEYITGVATVYDITPDTYAGENIEVCGERVELMGELSAESGVWSVDKKGDFEDESSAVTYFDAENIEIKELYKFTWTQTNKDCSSYDVVEVIFYEELNDAIVDAGEDIELFELSKTFLNAAPPLFGEGSWKVISGAGDIVNQDHYNSAIENLSVPGRAQLEWEVVNGACSFTDRVVVEVEKLQYPNGFSPNGDGVNDTFEIVGSHFIENNRLVIFNSSGKEVYRRYNYGKPYWDGRDSSGSMLPDGHYYFLFQGDNIDPIKDFVIIKSSDS
ncbi:gliding motility-associated C-terminal domain-containing protein [Marinilabiliaceae bacterium ANBcel2]|nr:gliding motility-associated C-terminal domain-containing protein [Marinilabiliaceae bacterium ANBcel2]